MDGDFRPDRETLNQWEEALGRLLDAIPKSKKALVFQDASFLELTAKRAIWALIKAQEEEAAAQ